MRRVYLAVTLMVMMGGRAVAASASLPSVESKEELKGRNAGEKIQLPEPKYEGKVSVEEALRKRRTVREYRKASLALSDVSQLLWAAQGITDTEKGLRTAPSAGATYPLEVYLVVGNVDAVKAGAYKYRPREHQLTEVKEGDVRDELVTALRLSRLQNAGAVIVFFAVYERTTARFGETGITYVHMEVGHAAQNVYLQATSLNLGTGVIDVSRNRQVKEILNVSEDERPLYMMPVGRI